MSTLIPILYHCDIVHVLLCSLLFITNVEISVNQTTFSAHTYSHTQIQTGYLLLVDSPLNKIVNDFTFQKECCKLTDDHNYLGN